jgi:hypothetical protein
MRPDLVNGKPLCSLSGARKAGVWVADGQIILMQACQRIEGWAEGSMVWMRCGTCQLSAAHRPLPLSPHGQNGHA